MKKKHIIILTTFLFQITFSQNAKLLSTANSELPEDDIWSVTVDNSGYKWFGTATKGLVKYENDVLKIFTPENSIIKGGHIGPLFVDSKGILWISASKPQGLFTLKNDSITEITNETIEQLGGITSIAQNSLGDLYFGGFNGLIKYDGENWSTIKLPLPKVIIRTIDINSNNTIAIGHNDGLIVGTENKWTIFIEEEDKLQLSVVRGLKFVSNEKLIIGYGGGMGNGGFSIKDGETWKHYNKTNSTISDHMIRDIEMDDKGNYWMASNNGLVMLTPDGNIKSILFREGMYKNTILNIAIENNNLWIATNFGIIELKN